jgi:hypothetical protein
MSRTNQIRFRLAIPAEKYLAYYQGQARDVVVTSEDGRRVRFPANALQQFVRHEGIFGLFQISFDENNKLIGVEKIGS